MTKLSLSPIANARRHRGQALILTLLLLALGLSLFLVGQVDSRSVAERRAAQTRTVLAETKRALIAWSAARTPPPSSSSWIRPGELPCPDMNNNGLDDDGGCAPGAIGRVPWKALGIVEPVDGTGETLWYAISGPFRYKYTPTTPPITSRTVGNLTVKHNSSVPFLNSSTTNLTQQAIAVLFAPGSPQATQIRSTATASCATTGTTIARNSCATNYLEAIGSGVGAGNNAYTGGPFIQAATSPGFNDQVLAITSADLMPLIEQRVAREILSLLKQYYDSTGVYPWPDRGGNGTSNVGYNRSHFPCSAPEPFAWGRTSPPVTPALPDWLTNGCGDSDSWTENIYYSAAQNRLPPGCTTCTSATLLIANSDIGHLCSSSPGPLTCTLTQVSIGPADVILMTPGTYNVGTSSWPDPRLPPLLGFTGDDIIGYFEDYENSHQDDDVYVLPATSTRLDHDRIYILR